VKLSPELESKLTDAAGRRGMSAETLAREAIERAIDYDAWFVREVERGLSQIATGDLLTHEAVGRQLEQQLRDQSRR
jgi:predicted transcriptional regulator